MKRLEYIDIIKGIAIILVVVGHFIWDEYNKNIFLIGIYSFHIPLFFIVTGMLLNIKDNWKCKSLKENFIIKSKKILWPYFTFSIALVILYKILGKNEICYQILLKTFSFEGYSVMWFLIATYIAQMLFFINYKIIKSNTKKYLLVEIVVLFIIMMVKNEYLLFLKRSIIGYTFIYIGYIGINVINKINFSNYRTIKLIISFFICLVLIYLSKYNGFVDLHKFNLGNVMLYYVFSISESFSIIIFIKNLNFKSYILSFYGKNSIIIMCTHLNFFIINIIDKIIKITNLINNSNILKFLEILILLIIEYFICLIINKYMKFLYVFPESIKKVCDKH